MEGRYCDIMQGTVPADDGGIRKPRNTLLSSLGFEPGAPE